MKKESLYSLRPNLVLGFHGTDEETAKDVIEGTNDLVPSMNEYDWLGHGIYFWENNEKRAWNFAEKVRKKGKIPAIIGAVIDLGYCMDLMDSEYLEELKEDYSFFKEAIGNGDIPENKVTRSGEVMKRDLDCAVIQYAHLINLKTDQPAYDSVRGVFWEGNPLYPGTTLREKNHIQICIRNSNCIKGYFWPREKTNGQIEELINELENKLDKKL